MGKNNYLLLFAAIGMLTACKPYEFKEPKETRNPRRNNFSVDFSKYIAFGASFTAGFMDDALYTEGQKSAFPNLLYKSFQALDTSLKGDLPFPDVGTEIGFSRVIVIDGPPLVSYNVGKTQFDNPHPRPLYEPAFQADGPSCLPFVPKPLLADKTPQQFFAPYTGKFNNYGIPGLTMLQAITPATADVFDVLFNPYYLRIASKPKVSTVLEDAAANDPTFFSIMLGESDIINFMRSGGETYLQTEIDFSLQMQGMLEALAKKGAKGVIATIPDFSDFPYFTVATEQGFSKERDFNLNSTEANSINQAYFLQGYPSEQYFKPGLNSYLVERSNGNLSQFKRGVEFVTNEFLPYLDSLGRGQIEKCGVAVGGRRRGMGIIHEVELVKVPNTAIVVPKAYPVPKRFILDEGEVAILNQRLSQYNAAIRRIQSTVSVNGVPLSSILAVADLYSAFKQLKRDRGLQNRDRLTIMYFDQGPAGVFSSDGLHPTPIGHAFIANVMINAINGHFGLNLPLHDLRKFRGNVYESRP